MKTALATLTLLASACAPSTHHDQRRAADPWVFMDANVIQDRAPATWFRGCRVFDGMYVTDAADVQVEGEVITRIEPDLSELGRGDLVECAGGTLMPALLDAHVFGSADAEVRTRALSFGVGAEIAMVVPPEALVAEEGPSAATHATLAAGSGWPATGPYRYGTQQGFEFRTLGWPDEAIDFYSQHKQSAAAFLLIVFEDDMPTLWDEVASRLIERAHKDGQLVVAFAPSCRHALRALNAGVDGVSTECSDPHVVLPASLDRKRFVIPSLVARAARCGPERSRALAADASLAPYLSDDETRSLRMQRTTRHSTPSEPAASDACVEQAGSFVGLAKEAGYRILAGTRAPADRIVHGASMHDELALLVAAGMSNLEALRSATRLPADTFGLSKVGRIEVGAYADLVWTRGNPSADIHATRVIEGVWKRGRRAPRPYFNRSR